MPTTGTLKSWNDERGFGFIAPSGGGAELFVHISAFPRGGPRPSIGEVLTYEIGRGKNGQPQAVRIARKSTAAGTATRRPARRHYDAPRRTLLGALVPLLLAGGGALAYWYFTSDSDPISTIPLTAPQPYRAMRQPDAPAFQCDGRVYCSQMTSCAEARYFLSHCPGTKMDGDNDGVPCEQQWCAGGFAR